MRKLSLTCIALLPAALGAQQLLPAPPAERCAPMQSSTSAGQWLSRSAASMLPKDLAGKVLRYRVAQDVPFWEQSERAYEPFIPNVSTSARWYDPATMLEARHPAERPIRHDEYPSLLYTPTAAFAGRDSMVRPLAQFMALAATARRENPWMTVGEWLADSASARVVERCRFRDVDRVVLQRGAERLYLSESDGMPVKIERTEPHYFWGQVRAEYLWGNWWGLRNSDGRFPLSITRVFDGSTYERLGLQLGTAQLVPIDSAPRLTVPSVPAMSEAAPPATPQVPDTVRIADNVFLLVTPNYTETVALVRDTVFLLDATTSEARARADSAAIAKLFPGAHPVVLVVTDLAWPHISGVRFWVARGATVVSHRDSEGFLKRVVDRKWTMAPDALEAARARVKWRFRPVTDSLVLAGGGVVVHALRGTTTEGAVGVWIPGVRYFWAGDYIQNSADSPYAKDVAATIRQLGITPAKIGAQHIKPIDWSVLAVR